MKILQISKHYAPFIGGVEQVAHDCSNALSENNEVKVFCFNHEKGNQKDFVDGVEIIRAGCFAKIASQSLSFSYGRLLKKAFREFVPDVVIFHYPNPFAAHYLLKILKKYPKCKLILYWHLDIVKQKVLRKLFFGQNKKLCKVADNVLGATPIHLNQSDFYHYFEDKCQILPYCIDDKSLTLSDEEKLMAAKIKEEHNSKIICFAMGRHVPYKGLIHLVNASKYLDDKYKIIIAGDGKLTSELKKVAGNDFKVSFLGRIDSQQRKVYLAACDIFCFPSVTRNENFGLALAEAMYFGKPAVTFTIPRSGVNYVSLNGVTGIEVPNSDDKQYAEAIEKLAADEELRCKLGQSAKERVVENFTFFSFKRNIINLIEELK